MSAMEKNPLSLAGKTTVVTGASSGIGLQTALDFCRSGAFVIAVGRDEQRCKAAREKILSSVPEAHVSFLLADLSHQSAVRRLAEAIRQTLEENGFSALDILVNNAGLFSSKRVLTEDGVEKTIAVNHLAPFLLTELLLPLLSNSADGRVITVSSGSHYHTWLNPKHLRNPFIFISLWQYKVSKLANVLFSLEFNLRHLGESVHAFAVDPGLVNTDIGAKNTGRLASYIWQKRQKAGVDPSIPAATILHVAVNPDAPESGAVYWHLSLPKEPSLAALDTQTARLLWEESARLCHLNGKEE